MFASTALRRVVFAFSAGILCSTSALVFAADPAALHRGYYSDPALHGDAIVFTAEGDLWSIDIHGGQARRLTTGTGTENKSSISPDGKTVAFRANYEGPAEVYTIPIDGGLPHRRTWDGNSEPEGMGAGWAVAGFDRTLFNPAQRRTGVISDNGGREMVPLAQAAQGAYSSDGRTLFFTRWFHQWSETKRYKGGWAENLWSFDGTHEAVPLTADYAGTSTNPMFFDGRVYFLSDRDGVMNVYSMDTQGRGVKEESHQHTFDIQGASLNDGRIVYACAGDVWLLDLKTGHEEMVPITLVSDFDQMRTHWVKKPLDYLTSVHISPDGSSAVFTARGEIFTLPAKSGRIIRVAGDSDVRYREARFMPDGKSIVALSTKSGETEFWKFAANGEGTPEQWTHDTRCSAGAVFLRPMVTGWQIPTRTSSFGFTTSRRAGTSSFRSR